MRPKIFDKTVSFCERNCIISIVNGIDCICIVILLINVIGKIFIAALLLFLIQGANNRIYLETSMFVTNKAATVRLSKRVRPADFDTLTISFYPSVHNKLKHFSRDGL